MKKGLLILFSLLFVCSAFAFEAGSMLIGGQAGLGFSKSDSDDDGTTEVVLFPQIGYFVTPNVCVDGIVKLDIMGSESMDVTAFGIGAGARYFFNRIYVGADVQYQSANISIGGSDRTETAMFGTIKGGYLFPILPGAYIDTQARYMMGLGDYGGDSSGSNEQSSFNIMLGLQVELTR